MWSVLELLMIPAKLSSSVGRGSLPSVVCIGIAYV